MEIEINYLPFKKQEQFHNSKAKFRLLSTGVGFGKCIAKGSRITLFDGTTEKIENIKRGEEVMSLDKNTFKPKEVVKSWYTGEKDAYEVTLVGNRKITVSEDHPFLRAVIERRNIPSSKKKDKRCHIPVRYEWKNVKNLHPMNFIAIPKGYSKVDIDYHTENDCLLLGLLLGDGCITKYASFSAENREVIDLISTLLPKGVYVKHSEKYDYRLKSDMRDKHGYGYNPLVAWLRKLGVLGTNSHTKFIPDEIKTCNEHSLFALLSGLIITDGSVELGKGAITYSTVSKRLSDDIEDILTVLGLSYNLYEKKNCYELMISGKEDLKRIHDNCILLHKGRKLKKLLKLKPEPNKHKGINKKYYDGEIEFRRVRYIRRICKVPMYDLEIKDTHNFVANNIVVHNTCSGVNELIKQCLISEPGCMYAMVAPTYKMLTNVTIREFMKFCPRELIKKYNRSDQLITLLNDVEITGIAGDREDTIDRLRGLNIGGFYGDEISLSPEYMHEILIARLRDSRGCLRGWYTVTPKGFNWLHRIFEDKKDKHGKPLKDPHNYEILKGTTLDNPYTPQEYKDTMINTYVGVFAKQEIYGEFVGYEGLVYPEFSRNVHVIDTENMKFRELLGGVDWGFTNPSVILVSAFDNDDRLFILSEFYQSHVTDQELAEIAQRDYSKITKFIADSENPGGIEEFKRKRLNCEGVVKRTTHETEKEASFILSGIKEITQRLKVQKDGKPRIFIDRRCVNTIMEFENYRYPDKKEDKPVQELPLKIHDHSLDVIRYLLESKRHKLAFAFA